MRGWAEQKLYTNVWSNGRTNNAAWFINDNELSFYIMVEDFDRSRRDRRFMPVDNIPME